MSLRCVSVCLAACRLSLLVSVSCLSLLTVVPLHDALDERECRLVVHILLQRVIVVHVVVRERLGILGCKAKQTQQQTRSTATREHTAIQTSASASARLKYTWRLGLHCGLLVLRLLLCVRLCGLLPPLMSPTASVRRSILTILADLSSFSRLLAGRQRTTTLTHSPSLMAPTTLGRQGNKRRRGDGNGKAEQRERRGEQCSWDAN